MVIQLVSNEYRKGYLPRHLSQSVSPFFSGGNLSIRRATLEELNYFDPDLRTGEDIDICTRGLQSRWELYFNSEARVEHYQRSRIRELIQQWFGYGYYHAHLFKKHNPAAIEVLTMNPHREGHSRYRVVYFSNRSPVRILAFLCSFSFFHLALTLFLVARLASCKILSLIFLGACAVFAFTYFRQDFLGKIPLRRKMAFMGIRYLVNASLMLGGLMGGYKEGYLYVYGTLWKKTGTLRKKTAAA